MNQKLRISFVSLLVLLIISVTVNTLLFLKITSINKPNTVLAVKEFVWHDRHNVNMRQTSFSPPSTAVSPAPQGFTPNTGPAYITVIFDTDVVPQRGVNTRLPQPPLVFTPRLSGVFEWSSRNSLSFISDSPLPVGTTIRARFTDYIEKLTAKTFRDREKDFVYSTPAVQLMSVRQIDTNTLKSVTVELGFDDKVETGTAAKYLSFTQNRRKIDFSAVQGNLDYSARFILSGVEEGTAEVSVRKGFKGTTGTIGVPDDIPPVRFAVSYAMHITDVDVSRYEDYTARIYSTAPIDVSSAKEFIRITPAVDFNIEAGYNTHLYGRFESGKIYEIRFLAGLRSRPDNERPAYTLVNDEVFNVVFYDLEPDAEFSYAGTYVMKNGFANIPLAITNIQELHVCISRIYDNNIAFLLQEENYWGTPASIKGLLAEKSIPAGTELNKPKTVLLNLNELLSGIESPRGAYEILVRASTIPANRPFSTSSYSVYCSKIVIVTDIGITAKKNGSDVFVWLNSISSATPVADASVTILSGTNQTVAKATSDKNGIVLFENLKCRNDIQPDFIIVRKDNDFTFLDFNAKTLSVSEFDTGGRPVLLRGYEAFMFCDRELYRPGEEAHLKIIVRGPECGMPEKFPIQVDITRPGNQILLSRQILLSGLGTGEVDIDIPDYTLTGRYRVTARIPGNDYIIGSLSFLVQDYVPDTIRVSVSCPDVRFPSGAKVPVSVQADYYFGRPVADSRVELKAFLKPADFFADDLKNYVFGGISGQKEPGMPAPFLTTTLKTNSAGLASFEIELPKNPTPASMLRLNVEASVTPEGGRTVTARTSAEVDPYPYYIGIKEFSGSDSASRNFSIAVVSPEGNLCEEPSASVTVTLFKVNYYYVFQKKADGTFEYVYNKDFSRVETRTLPLRSGIMLNAGFSVKESGDYLLRASSSVTGHTADLPFYKDYGYYSVFEKQETPYHLKLEADKKEYDIGDTAVIRIPVPFEGRALFTVEREKIFLYQVVDARGGSISIPVEIRPDYAPDVYVSLHLLIPSASPNEPGFLRAYGIERLNINTAHKDLAFDMDAAETVGQGEKLKIRIHTGEKDAPAEFAVAVVDEGVCALTGYKTPDPKGFFYGVKKLGVLTADMYSYLMPDLDEKRLRERQKSGGGDAGYFEQAPEEILNFVLPLKASKKTVAFWEDRLVPDRNGNIDVSFDVQEFSGELRIMAFGISSKRFASRELRTKISAPVVIQPTIPVTLTNGDLAEIPVAVFNNTGEPREITVSIATNRWLNLSAPAEKKIMLLQGKETVLYFAVRAEGLNETGTIDIAASAENFNRTLHYEIPVRPANPFMTYSGSGSLTAVENNNRGITVPLKLSGEWVKGTEDYSITFSSMPAIGCLPALRYLKSYPYGCVEQTASKCFALLYYKELLRYLDEKTDEQEINAMLDSGIRRLWMMQAGNGGLSMWPGHGDVYTWGSIYAAHFLTEAKKKGLDINESKFNALLSYVKEEADRHDRNVTSAAYAVYVLSLNGEKDVLTLLNSLTQKTRNPAPIDRYLMGLAGLYAGDKKLAQRMLGPAPSATTVAYSETGDDLRSSVKENALLLMAMIETDPAHTRIPQLITAIEREMKDGFWGNTQNTAFAVMALGRAAYVYGLSEPVYTAVIRSNGKEFTAFTEKDTVTIEKNSLQSTDIEIEIRGRGTLFYSWKASGIPAVPPEPADRKLKIRRSFFDMNGNIADLGSLKHGQLLSVQLDVEADSGINNVVITDMLASGMEIENPALLTCATGPSAASGNNGTAKFLPQASQFRSDRLVLFGSLDKTRRSYSYLVRAVVPGEYYLPPVSAECMYAQDCRSTKGAGTIRIMK